MSRPRIRGNWHHGIKGYFVDVRALDAFLKLLPWMLAIDAIIRGWEYMRIGGYLLVDWPTELVVINGESLVEYQFFGISMFLAGLLLAAGMLLRRFSIIIVASLLGAAIYALLSGSFIVESFTGGDTNIGLRHFFTVLVLTVIWIFKATFAATKKSISDINREADKQTEEFLNG